MGHHDSMIVESAKSIHKAALIALTFSDSEAAEWAKAAETLWNLLDDLGDECYEDLQKQVEKDWITLMDSFRGGRTFLSLNGA